MCKFVNIRFSPTNGSVNTGSWECRQGNKKWQKAHSYEKNGYLNFEVQFLPYLRAANHTSTCDVSCRKTYGKYRNVFCIIYLRKAISFCFSVYVVTIDFNLRVWKFA